jgi:hypothetical protein
MAERVMDRTYDTGIVYDNFLDAIEDRLRALRRAGAQRRDREGRVSSGATGNQSPRSPDPSIPMRPSILQPVPTQHE